MHQLVTLTLKMPLLYMSTSEKAKPCVSTLSNQPFMMAGTLNQYSGNCGSRRTHTHTAQFSQSQVPAPYHSASCLRPLTWKMMSSAASTLRCSAMMSSLRRPSSQARMVSSPYWNSWVFLDSPEEKKKITSYKFSGLIHQKLCMFLELHRFGFGIIHSLDMLKRG